MLSIFLTKKLEENASDMANAQVIFYFCSQEKRNTGIDVLRGLLYQILTKRSHLVKHASAERTQQTLSSFEALWIITKCIEDLDLGTIFCVLDGLDECDEHTIRVLVPRIVRIHSKFSIRLVQHSREQVLWKRGS